MSKCSFCDNEFEDEYFEEDQNKCILHCEKNTWYDINNKGDKNWEKSKEKIKVFWETFYGQYDQERLKFKIDNMVFPKFEGQGLSESTFRKSIFEHLNCNLSFKNCIFEDNISLYNFNKELKFENCKFRNNFEIVIKKKEITTFLNCYFKYLQFRRVDIKNTMKFEDCHIEEFILQNVDFEFIFSFIKSTVSKKIELEHVEFSEEAFFNESTFNNDLDFTKSIFYKQKNFFGLKTKVANRETARIIKDSFEQQNNIIVANKFYALEMQKREEELNLLKNPLEWLVFKTHSLASNHSQEWFLSLLWIIIISFIVGIFNQQYYFEGDKYLFITLLLIIPVSIGLFTKNITRNIGLLFFTIILYSTTNINLDFIANQFNPFSIMTGDEKLTFGSLIYKITIGYLIYQLIISIRQNTRRK